VSKETYISVKRDLYSSRVTVLSCAGGAIFLCAPHTAVRAMIGFLFPNASAVVKEF
jgi:hypothetical protein